MSGKLSKKVLIVDDDPSILLSLEFLMVKNGFQVFIARNGNEAIEIIRSQEPHIVILDIMMPDVDGYDVCRYVRENDEWDTMKLVLLSAKSKKEDIDKGLSLGASRYLTKPFSTRDLLKTVQELV